MKTISVDTGAANSGVVSYSIRSFRGQAKSIGNLSATGKKMRVMQAKEAAEQEFFRVIGAEFHIERNIEAQYNKLIQLVYEN